MEEACLYGIVNSNRKNEDFWSKNRFNSSFPVALANYMRDRGINAKYIKVDKNLEPVIDEIDIGEAYNARDLRNEELFFSFESRYTPYQKYIYGNLTGIDLVIKDTKGNCLRPLEVKLTVLPDNSTAYSDQTKWGSELVFRPPTTIYCALGMCDEMGPKIKKVRDILENECSKIGSWDNNFEISAKLPVLTNLLNDVEKQFYKTQKPLILQPIWKTKRKSPFLCEDAFDVFVWSDYAFSRLFLNSGEDSWNDGGDCRISRSQRSIARLGRCMYEISKAGRANIEDIYGRMTFGHQTDKEFAVNGTITNRYMRCERLTKPIVKKNELGNIILNGGEDRLSPERRFDQTVFFTMRENHRPPCRRI